MLWHFDLGTLKNENNALKCIVIHSMGIVYGGKDQFWLASCSSLAIDHLYSSSVASAICQEGQNERTFLIFPLFS